MTNVDQVTPREERRYERLLVDQRSGKKARGPGTKPHLNKA